MSEKKRKPPALSLSAAPPAPAATDSPDGGEGIIADVTSKYVTQLIKKEKKIILLILSPHPIKPCPLLMHPSSVQPDDKDWTEEQKMHMAGFFTEKARIIEQGEMKEQHFVRLSELGFGNGGVVLKVEHKPTGIIMARKVLTL